MRAIAATVTVLGLIAAWPAYAGPTASPGPAKHKAKAAAKAKPAAKANQSDEAKKEAPAGPPAPAPASAPGFGLGSMAAQAAGAAAPADTEREKGVAESRRLDLTPRTQFDSGKVAGQGDQRGKERRSGLNLGNDGDWRVQAAQVGVMVGVFGALVAACANGGCLLPEVFGGGRDELGPPSGLQTRDSGKLRDGR
ncbi:MAG TPA: hypothetical protein VKB80_03085 [Kofleriaceae bacterium]|nr:hypothetical protein [Kofleriaceae bacterium]